MKRFMVIGLGRFGMSLATSLAEEHVEVIAIDTQMDRVDAVRDKVSVAVQLDSTDIDALKSVGADRVDVVVVAIGENFEASVVSTAILKELGIKEIFVRAYTEREKKILLLVGATRILMVEDEMGHRLAKAITGNAILEYVELSSTHSIIQWKVPQHLVGLPLEDLTLSEKWDISLLAIKREPADAEGKTSPKTEHFLEFYPRSAYLLQENDILVLGGRNKDLTRFTSQKENTGV